jgi:hypothetical protein
LSSDSFELRIDCIIEERNNQVREVDTRLLSNEVQGVEDQFMSALSLFQEAKTKVKELQKVKEFSDWCREVKEDPNLLLSGIVDKFAKELLAYTKPFYTMVFLESIGISSQFQILNSSNYKKLQPQYENGNGKRNRSVHYNLEFQTVPIHPYIEATLLMNGIKQSSFKLVFKIETLIKV